MSASVGSNQRLWNWYMLLLRYERSIKEKEKDWLARYQNNVFEWSDMSSRRLLFQWASAIKIQLSVLVYYKVNLIIISLKVNLFSPCYSWKIAELALNNNHSLKVLIHFSSDIAWFLNSTFLSHFIVSFSFQNKSFSVRIISSSLSSQWRTWKDTLSVL